MCLESVVVVMWYIDFVILLIPTPLVSALFCSSIPAFFKMFFVLLEERRRMPNLDLFTSRGTLNCAI